MLLFNGSRFNMLDTCGVRQATPVGLVPWFNLRFMCKMADNMRLSQYSSIPAGYTDVTHAWLPSMHATSFIAARLTASSDTTPLPALTATGNLTAALLPSSAITQANANSALNAYATLTGVATVTPGLSALGNMHAKLDAGAQPSAFDIAQETMGQIVESGVSLKEVLRLLLAVAAGDATGLDANPAFKSVDGAKTRVAGTRSGGNRSITTRDPS